MLLIWIWTGSLLAFHSQIGMVTWLVGWSVVGKRSFFSFSFFPLFFYPFLFLTS